MIREATKEDIRTINQIGLLIKKDFEKSYQLQDFINYPYGKIYLYEEDNEIQGFIQIEIHYEIIDIINIAVIKQYQKKGIASKLMDFIIKNYKHEKMLLEVNEENDAAIKLYKKMRFIEIHRRRQYYGIQDAIIMERTNI